MEQIGLPVENANFLCRVYREYLEGMRSTLLSSFLKANELTSLKHRIDFDLQAKQPNISLSLSTSSGPCTFAVSSSMLGSLISELERASKIMNLLPKSLQ